MLRTPLPLPEGVPQVSIHTRARLSRPTITASLLHRKLQISPHASNRRRSKLGLDQRLTGVEEARVVKEIIG